MQIRRTIWEALKVNAAAVVALASLAVCLTGLVQVCRCDADPDGCGQACHVCDDGAIGAACPSGEACAALGEETAACSAAPCDHLTLSVGDLFATSASVSAPAFCAAPPAWPALARRTAHPLRLRPVSTAPPDAGACCALSSFTRLYPRS